MTGPQQNRLAMCLAVLGVMQKYNSLWSVMTAMADMVTRLQDLTTSIQEASGVQGSPLTGIAGGKRRKRIEMTNQTLAIAGDLHALAVKNGNTAMQAKCDIQPTDLNRLGDTEVAPRCQEIRDLANTNAAALVAFGVTAADITALQTAIDDYKALMTKPREAVVARKGVTTDIGDTEDAATELLETELDKSMKKFETKNADFFGEYKNARMIIDLGAPTSEKKPPKPAPPAHP